MISFREKGDFTKLTSYLERVKEGVGVGVLNKYGRAGVNALAQATPKDTGKTANSWKYEVQNDGKTASISFYNTNENHGVPIAIILEYGHGTRNGGWVAGRNYINPAIQPVFDKILADAWKEVTKE